MRIAVLGSGRMARCRAQNLARCDEVRDIVVGARDIERARSVADSCGGMPASFDEALGTAVDAVMVTVATVAHADVLRSVLKLGVPVFCEKPLTGDAVVSRGLATEADRRGIPLQIGYHRRFDPGIRAIREAVAAGEVGEILSLSVISCDHRLPDAAFVAGSGGVFRDFHVHDFDMARWVTGLEVENVFAMASVRADSRFVRYGDCDTTAVVCRMTGGVLFGLQGSRFHPRGQDVRLEVRGSKDCLVAGLNGRSPLRAVGAGDTIFDAPPYDNFLDRFADAFAAETASFVDLVSGRGTNPCPASEDLAALEVALACVRSAETGERVSVRQAHLARGKSGGEEARP